MIFKIGDRLKIPTKKSTGVDITAFLNSIESDWKYLKVSSVKDSNIGIEGPNGENIKYNLFFPEDLELYELKETKDLVFEVIKDLPDIAVGARSTYVQGHYSFPCKPKMGWETRRYRVESLNSEFFKIVEEPLKVGDWVIHRSKASSSNVWKYAFRVTKIKGQYLYKNNYNQYIEDFRRATPEEIEQASTVIINGYRAEKVSGGVKFGCQLFSTGELKTLFVFLQRDISAQIKVGDTIITPETIEILLNL